MSSLTVVNSSYIWPSSCRFSSSFWSLLDIISISWPILPSWVSWITRSSPESCWIYLCNSLFNLCCSSSVLSIFSSYSVSLKSCCSYSSKVLSFSSIDLSSSACLRRAASLSFEILIWCCLAWRSFDYSCVSYSYIKSWTWTIGPSISYW